jgi:hypothetical protein
MLENTLPDLYRSAVDAFPHTRRRQHVTGPVEISDIRYTPFLGMQTLLVRAAATNEGREYSPVILFKRVSFTTEGVEFTAHDDNKVYHIAPQNYHVLVRCNCPDFFWRFNYYDHLEQSLHGKVRKEYSGSGAPANPLELPGMCKHLMKLQEVLRELGI